MNHHDHVQLIRDGVQRPQGVWADLGAGDGAFTLALGELLREGAHIHAVDKNRRALNRLQRQMTGRFPRIGLTCHAADFTRRLSLPALDGVIMANALHFVKRGTEQTAVLQSIRELLRPGGHFILVEYDTDHGNRWVPYPISLATWEKAAPEAGFTQVRLLHSRPSRFLGRIYAAVSVPLRNP